MTNTPYIAELNKDSLWNAWKEIRKLLTRSSRRDVTDYLEFDLAPAAWMDRLLSDVNSGRYEPRPPFRFTLAKNLGFSRTMTFPQVPDLVLYRALTDLIFKKLKPFEEGNVYFARNTLSKRRRDVPSVSDDPAYLYLSGSAYLKWKEFHQYRKRLILKSLYPYFVLTDITNYFDSVLYARTIDALQEVGFGRNFLGLLLFLLERLSPRDPYSESPRIGLPVDEFDCSRTLAHVVLFTHDRRMIDAVGEAAYVRWMDDQLMGVKSRAAGVKALAHCGASLSRLHLTPNTAKSRILSLRAVAKHFHLELNHELDQIEQLLEDESEDDETAAAALETLWAGRQGEQHGEWKKILLRFYRLSGICRCDFLLDQAEDDLLREPTLATRIADYVRVVGTPARYCEFFLRVYRNELQVYPDVSRFLVEGLLKVEADRDDATWIRSLASELLAGRRPFVGWRECAALAPLLILRFGDRRALPRLRAPLRDLGRASEPAIGKAVAVVYASYGDKEAEEVVKAAGSLSDN